MNSTANTFFIFALAVLLLSACTQKQDQSVAEIIPDSVYLNRGNALVAMTFDTLRHSLLAAVGEHGFPYAITFCNEHAESLTSTYAENDATIRRASMRYRNPLNEPDSLERIIFTQFEKEGPSTKIILTQGEVHFIKPIFMQAMCLNCHGIPNEQILPETLEKIRDSYPADQATGYAEGDLRGIWHIVFRQ